MEKKVLKKGMALPIVLAFATIMGVVSAFLIKSTKSVNTQMQSSMDQLQSYFIARAGAEHAALKIKYLNSELYDAICMKQGRNPLFNYSLIQHINTPWEAINQYNPGPIFLYPQTQQSNYPRTNIISNMSNKRGYDNWINTFKCDLVSDTNSIPGTIRSRYGVLNIINSMPTPMRNAMGNRIFRQAVYQLSNIDVAASEIKRTDTRVENNMIVEFVINSILQTAKGQDFNYEIRKTIKVSRDR